MTKPHYKYTHVASYFGHWVNDEQRFLRISWTFTLMFVYLTVVLITYNIITLVVRIYTSWGVRSKYVLRVYLHKTLHSRKSYFLLFIIRIAADFRGSNKKNKSSQFLQIWQVKAIFKDLLFARPKSETIIHSTFSLSLSISLYLFIF